jgi:hypothetical protein
VTGRGPLLVALLAAACSPPPPPAFAPCAIQEPGCRVDTYLALEAERGQIWDPWAQPPPVVIIDVNELQRRLDLVGVAGFSWPNWANWTTPLQDLGLLGPEMNVVEADQRWELDNLAARYWSNDKEVSIVDRGLPLDDILATATLAHEYTHAAQDREFGLRFDEGRISTDREMVRQSLVEGEAQVYEMLAEQRMKGMDPEAVDWNGHFGSALTGVRDQTLAYDSPHTLIRRALPYPAGGLLMGRAWQQGRSTAVNRIILSPPASFVSIMLALEGRPAAVAPPRLCPHRLLPERFHFADTDRLGAGLFYAYLARAFGNENDAWQAALTWRDDQLWSLLDVTSNTAVTFWRVRAPGLRDTAIGAMLAARTEPPRLVGDEFVFWTGLDQPSAELLVQATNCDP